MGWTCLQMRGRQVDQQFFASQFRPMEIHDIHAGPEGVFYLVASRQVSPQERFAVVVLTERSGDELCYNEISEHMEPYYYDCPARLLDQLTPTDDKGATIWREICRKRNQPKPAKASLADRLAAMGYSTEERRGKTFLDGNDVCDIIGNVPVSYTRRRYSNTTFCWVKAYVGGWFDLGDPHQSVTPKRAAVEADLSRLLAQQTLAESGTANPAS